MDTRVKIETPRSLVDRAIEWGRASVMGYRSGEKEASRQFARPGIAESLDAQAMGRLGEIAFCLWAGVDPNEVLDWGKRPDRGYDMLLGKARIDVKTSGTDCLIWPVTKNNFLDSAPIDIFVLAGAEERPLIYLLGWVSKRFFVRRHLSADEAHRFDTGTKYLPADHLHRMGVFPGRSDDPREHYCWCGEWGSRGKHETWLCEMHTAYLPVEQR